jgi:putative ABC transport system permease protein
MKRPNNKPPGLGQKLLRLLVAENEREALLGDFAEAYEERSAGRGRFAARLWYWLQIFLLLPGFMKDSITGGFAMIKNYAKIAFRNMRKHKAYALINLAGLSIGMACFIFIFLFVRNELNFDGYHEKGNRIFRVVTETVHSGRSFHMAPTMLPLAPALLNDFPDIPYATRISERNSTLFSSGNKKFYETLFYADPDIFRIFSFHLLKGDPATALSEPNSLLLTEEMAEKYFGRVDPIGGVVTINGSALYRVTGILEEIPDNSHFKFRSLASFSSLKNVEAERLNNWTRFSNDFTYIYLPDNVDPAGVEIKFPAFLAKYLEKDAQDEYKLHLQPLREIHFSSLANDSAITYEKKYLYSFSAVGLFILLLACINFMNLATAHSSRRAREVGLRKVVGAQRIQLIRQFFAESVLTSLLALALSILLVGLWLPGFGRFVRRVLPFNPAADPGLIGIMLGIALFVGLFSGSYPALFLSAISPVRILRRKIEKGTRRLSFRAFLVVLQFAVSIALIISTLTIHRQIQFMRQKELGFQKDQVVVISLQNSSVVKKLEQFKVELLSNPSIRAVSASSGAPASGSTQGMSFLAENPGKQSREVYMHYLSVDYDFLKTLGLELVAGRGFSREFSTDVENALILNETAVKELGWDSALGKWISRGSRQKGHVIGVVKDFHYRSPRSTIEPTLLTLLPSSLRFVLVNVRPENMTETVGFLGSKWREFAPEYPFEYFFIDQQLERYYGFEKRLGTLFTNFSLLAIFISCLGVLGLISFTAEQAAKEIGIRKVLGASAAGIVVMLTKRFIGWVLIANVIAWPAAYFAMREWLQGFPYRTTLGIWPFLLAAVLAAGIALLTVGYQALNAALANPVECLRYE